MSCTRSELFDPPGAGRGDENEENTGEEEVFDCNSHHASSKPDQLESTLSTTMVEFCSDLQPRQSLLPPRSPPAASQLNHLNSLTGAAGSGNHWKGRIKKQPILIQRTKWEGISWYNKKKSKKILGILKMESFWHKLPEFWPQSSVWIQPKSCLVSIISFAATTLLHRVLLQCFRHALCLNFSAVLSFRSCGDFKLPAPLLLLLLELLLLLRWLHIAELTHPRDETGNTKCRLEKNV